MKQVLRVLGMLVCLAAVIFWMARGGNRGWTKTSVQVKRVDPITEQDIVAWEDRFVPGIEFLAGSVFAGCLLIGFSFLVRSNR